MGYKNVNVIPLDQADLFEFKWVKTLQEVSGKRDLFAYSKFVKAIIFFLKKAKLLSDIQTAEGLFRAYERNQGDTTKVFKTVIDKLDQTNTLKELRRFKNVIKEDFNKIDVDRTRTPLKIMLSGEIHICLEPFVNVDIRRKMGEMGVEVHQFLSLYDWVAHKFHLNYHRKWLEHLSRPYLPMDIGGEAIWVIGSFIHAAHSRLDGFIHCYPFTCMPEVTARTIITNKLRKMYDLPIIYFSFDEHSGTEGMRTRLEAFVDLMEGRRKKAIGEMKNLGTKYDYGDIGDKFYKKCLDIIKQNP